MVDESVQILFESSLQMVVKTILQMAQIQSQFEVKSLPITETSIGSTLKSIEKTDILGGVKPCIKLNESIVHTFEIGLLPTLLIDLFLFQIGQMTIIE